MKTRRTMKHRIFLTLALIFSLADCFGATAESILLPSPPPAETAADPDQEQAGMDSGEAAVGELPDPSYNIRSVGEIQEGFLTIGETSYDVRIYPEYNIGDTIARTAAGNIWIHDSGNR